MRESRVFSPNFTTNTTFKRREAIVIDVRTVSIMKPHFCFILQITVDTAFFFRAVDHSEKTIFVGYVSFLQFRKGLIEDKKMSGEKFRKKTIATGYLHDNLVKVPITDEILSELYQKSYFGKLSEDGSVLYLEPEEAVLLMDRNRLVIIDPETNQTIPFSQVTQHFIKQDSDFWVKYRIYSDLRNRGYIIRKSSGTIPSYRLYPRGSRIGESHATNIVIPLSEGKSISLIDLDIIVSQATRERKRVILGILDRVGDTTFYTASPLEFQPNPYQPQFKRDSPPKKQNSTTDGE